MIGRSDLFAKGMKIEFVIGYIGATALRSKGCRFFSQDGEDFLLWQVFNYKKTGFHVDVGAFDGIHLSNTYSFE